MKVRKWPLKLTGGATEEVLLPSVLQGLHHPPGPDHALLGTAPGCGAQSGVGV